MRNGRRYRTLEAILRTAIDRLIQSQTPDSNRRPLGPEPNALSTELQARGRRTSEHLMQQRAHRPLDPVLMRPAIGIDQHVVHVFARVEQQ